MQPRPPLITWSNIVVDRGVVASNTDYDSSLASIT